MSDKLRWFAEWRVAPMSSSKSTVMLWIRQFLKPYLEERLKMLVAAEGSEALNAGGWHHR